MGGANLSTSGNFKTTSGSSITGFSSGLNKRVHTYAFQWYSLFILQFFKNFNPHLSLASSFCIIPPPVNEFLKINNSFHT